MILTVIGIMNTLKMAFEINPDGCIPAYKGFHPHSLAGNNYAFIREKNGWMTKIQEKNHLRMTS